MKKFKISFLALLILTTLSANAQLSFGVKGGLSVSNLNTNTKEQKNSVKIGFNAGLTAEYMFNENMGIQSGLSYTTLGAKTSIDVPLFGKTTNAYKLNALQVPVHFAFRINVTDELNVTLHGGPYAGYIFSGKNVTTSEKGSLEVNLYAKEAKTLNNFDAGLGFGVAFGYGSMYVDLGYDMGLINLYNISKADKDALKTAKLDTPHLKTMNMYLSLGYKF